ncbi:hypothetical protein FB45DRAFT_901786 [Roridomyces roridus]|uniref:F-box domain-containing protein n=1 Tax=Roridomyces roridus TaxID=1738132 RepID=A0AAD7FTP9_9AGAR|nr:hypothetical protein FB45DRAFT_901786 [Roridomyces roridus]
MASSLLSLPPELLLHVVDAIQDAPSLRTLILTCKVARALAEPVLYRAVLVTTGSQAVRLAAVLQQNRIALVQDVNLRPIEYENERLEVLTPLIGAMTQLRTLAIESPFANYGLWRSNSTRWGQLMEGYHEMFLDSQRGVGLQNLQSLTIHWCGVGSRFWILSEVKTILTLPSLQSLTISCAVLDDDLTEELAGLAGTTRLTHLELIECFVTHKGLIAVLSLPRALQSCLLGGLRHHSCGSTRPAASVEQQLDALRQQCHSLEQFTWYDKRAVYDADDTSIVSIPSASSLRDFTELRTLTVDGAASLLFSILLSSDAPPNLRRLRVIRHDQGDVLDAGGETREGEVEKPARILSLLPPRELHKCLPSLRHLDVVFSPSTRWGSDMDQSLMARADRRERVKRAAAEYRGIALTIFLALRGSVIPPYLYGEMVPREEVAYRAEDGWFEPRMME